MTRIVSMLLHDVYRRQPGESGFSGGAADRYKLPLRECDSLLASLAVAWPEAPILADDFSTQKRAAFTVTVDDGGESYYTVLADRLAARGWRGHCFMSTGMIGRRGFLTVSQLRELDRRGHLIGSHSATHPTRFSACSRARMLSEWSNSRQVLEDLLGHEVRVASLPGGYFSTAVAETAREAGIAVLFTSEPMVRPRVVGGCLVAGRLTVRPGCRDATASALARGASFAVLRQWMTWNAKKLIKPVLGPAYPRLSAWMATPR